MRAWEPRRYLPDDAGGDALPQERRGGWSTGMALLLGLALSGGLLLRLAGPPRFPASPPTLDGIVALMRSADPDLTGLAPWLFLAAWALWAWVVVSVLLQAVVATLDVLT